jgi:hypothetical protein
VQSDGNPHEQIARASGHGILGPDSCPPAQTRVYVAGLWQNILNLLRGLPPPRTPALSQGIPPPPGRFIGGRRTLRHPRSSVTSHKDSGVLYKIILMLQAAKVQLRKHHHIPKSTRLQTCVASLWVLVWVGVPTFLMLFLICLLPLPPPYTRGPDSRSGRSFSFTDRWVLGGPVLPGCLRRPPILIS